MNQIDFRDKGNVHQSNNYFKHLRFSKLMESSMSYPLVVVHAGTGYGKTQAVRSFLENRDNTHMAWIQIDEWANTPALFWEMYLERLSLAWPAGGARLPEHFPDTAESFAVHSSVIRESSQFPGKHVIVFDDFHLLTNTAVLRFIERTVQILPQNIVVIIISRSTPKFNLIRMMMNERIFIMDEDTLRFTESEIMAYFNQLDLCVERQHIRDIWEYTRGWAFAVNLIGRALANEPKNDRYVLEAMRSNLLRFIESDLSPVLSEPLFRFLLRISLIDHFATDLIKTIAKDDALIREMEQLSAYLRYDFQLDAYVIHHLFLDYLQQNQNQLTEAEKRETYQSAAIWCAANHYEIDALSYYEKSEDYDAIMQRINAFHLQIPEDQARCALNILCRMPEHIKAEHPLFPLSNLKLHMSLGHLEEASALVEQYANEYEARPESDSNYRALAGIYGAWGFLRLILSPYTDVYDFDKYLEKQRICYDKAPYESINLYTNQSAGAYALLVGNNRAGAPEEYIGALERSIPHVLHVFKENLDGLDDLARGDLFFYRRNIDDAEKSLKQALDKARTHKQYDMQCRALFHLMFIAFLRGNFATAQTTLQTVEDLLYEKEYTHRFMAYDICNGFYYLMLDQPEQIPHWLKGDFSCYTHPALLENYANWVKAQYHYRAGQYNTLLAFIENDCGRQAILFGKIVFKILEALALYQLKRRQQAIAVLTEVYHLAAPNQIVTPFIQYAKDMRTLTAAALRGDGCEIPKEWLEDINRKASAFAKKRTRMISDYKAANDLLNVISLTKRENDILIDLSHGLSRSEIAASQNISVNTVKMAINIIYEKLQANNLAEAIRIASAHKII